MYSISEISKESNLSSRTLRYYEDRKLISSTRQAKNGYRYYNKKVLELLERIKKYKRMQFSLEEISTIINMNNSEMELCISDKLKNKFESITHNLEKLEVSKNEILTKLNLLNTFIDGEPLDQVERMYFFCKKGRN